MDADIVHAFQRGMIDWTLATGCNLAGESLKRKRSYNLVLLILVRLGERPRHACHDMAMHSEESSRIRTVIPLRNSSRCVHVDISSVYFYFCPFPPMPYPQAASSPAGGAR